VVLFRQDSRSAALRTYEESLDAFRRLAAALPENLSWRRTLRGQLIKVGRVRWDQNDLSGSRAAFEEAVRVSSSLADAAPSELEAQADLANAHSWVGRIAGAQDDHAAARTALQTALDMRRRQHANAAPDHPFAHGGLLTAMHELATELLAQGNERGAIRLYREALEMTQRRARSGPDRDHDMFLVMSLMAAIPESGVTWTELADLMERTEQDGRLREGDRELLEEARQHRAQAADAPSR
jgi:tetratricopeptide (TPR) repeat protein